VNGPVLPVASLFLVHTPFQVFVAEHMVRTMPGFRDGDRVLALDMPATNARYDPGLWSTVLELPPIKRGVLRRGRSGRLALQALLAALRRYARCEVLVSDIAWPLNNAVAATLSRVNGGIDLTLSLFPDGLVTYLGATVTPRLYRRGLLKRLLGRLGGVPYISYRGNLTGADWMGISAIYTPHPELTPAPRERLVPIPPFTPPTTAPQPRGCVYLGQSVEHILSRQRYERFCLGALACVRGLGYETVMYKPHHFESAVSRHFFEEAGVEILDDPRPIEEVFRERPFECVVSYNTSAFVNLKLVYGDRVRCVSYGNAYLTSLSWEDRPYAARMRDLFTRLGVEIVDVGDGG
jgi:hypothetical protein